MSYRAACSQGLERRGRELDCLLRADTSRQQVGPPLGAVEAAHVPVLGVEDEGSASAASHACASKSPVTTAIGSQCVTDVPHARAWAVTEHEREPSAGLEPATPSLPWQSGRVTRCPARGQSACIDSKSATRQKPASHGRVRHPPLPTRYPGRANGHVRLADRFRAQAVGQAALENPTSISSASSFAHGRRPQGRLAREPWSRESWRTVRTPCWRRSGSSHGTSW